MKPTDHSVLIHTIPDGAYEAGILEPEFYENLGYSNNTERIQEEEAKAYVRDLGVDGQGNGYPRQV